MPDYELQQQGKAFMGKAGEYPYLIDDIGTLVPVQLKSPYPNNIFVAENDEMPYMQIGTLVPVLIREYPVGIFIQNSQLT